MRKRPCRLVIVAGLALAGIFSPPPSAAQNPELRGFWADIWHEGFKSTAQIDSMVSRAVQGRYNAIFAEVLGYHDNRSSAHGAYWNSALVPKAPDISGGIDPLAYLVQRAHANGIEVHAWLVPYRACTVWPPAGNATLAAHPEWVMTTLANMGLGPSPLGSGGDATYYLDPGSPDVQEYVIAIARELVTNYQIDGIHWDYIRYTQTDAGYPADTSYTRSGLARFKAITGYTGTPSTGYGPWNDFRRREITELVRRARAEIASITSNPRQPVRHSASLITWGNAPTSFTSTSAWQRFQNWEEWQRLGYLDTAVLMTYYDDDQYPTYFRNWVNQGMTWSYARHMVIGPGIYINTFANSIDQMAYARNAGADGLCTYSYRVTNDVGQTWYDWYPYVAANLFTTTAGLPAMTWRYPATATEGTLWGRVTDGSGQPIDDASVQVDSMSPVKTDGNGYYVVTLIPAAAGGTNYRVTASKSGYPTVVHDPVQVVAGDIRRDDFVLGSGTPAPTITAHPQPQTVAPGGMASFTVSATGSGTLTYQWQKNGADLSNGGHYSGVTTPVLTITNVDASDVGNYRCAVTNAGGTTLSNEAPLSLQGGGAEFIVESRPGGKNYANYSEVGTWSDSTAKSTAPGVTAGIGSRVAYISAPGRDARFRFTPSTTGLYEVFATWPLSTNTPQFAHHIVSHAGGTADLYLDQNNNTNPGASTRWNSMGQYTLNAGTQYEVTVTSTGSSAGSGSTALRADAVRWLLISTPQPPVITQQPTAQEVCPGATATFTVAAAGDNLTYWWTRNGIALTDGGHYSGVTTPTLLVQQADAGDVANYACLVSNAGGSTSSEQAALTLREATAIVEQPAAQAVCPDGRAVFTVVAAGNGTLTYRWQKNGTDLSDGGPYSGVTTDTLTITPVTAAEVGDYRCVVTGDCGSVVSAAVPLTISGTSITQQPAPQSVCPGGTAQFHVAAIGEGTLAYQWQKNQTDLTDGGHYSGVHTATLVIAGADAADAADYRCVVTGACGTAVSDPASLTLRSQTTIVSHPTAQRVCAGASTQLTVTAAGSGTLSYRWQKNGADLTDGGGILGSTSATLTISPAAPAHAGAYRCVVTGQCGTATSDEALLSVTPIVRADFGADCDVDLNDFAVFQMCFNGANQPPASSCSADADFDDDGDVDVNDFAVFQACFNGAQAPPACDE